MLGVDCLISRGDRVLLRRSTLDGVLAPELLPLAGTPYHGESPIHACVRIAREQASLQVSPSCAAVLLHAGPNLPVDYRLAFIAQLLQNGPAPSPEDEFAWVTIDELIARPDVPEFERRLLPQLITVGTPIEVIVQIDASKQPAARSIGQIAPIDPARLSPLVFAVTN